MSPEPQSSKGAGRSGKYRSTKILNFNFQLIRIPIDRKINICLENHFYIP
jgi:hypothetical protein